MQPLPGSDVFKNFAVSLNCECMDILTSNDTYLLTPNLTSDKVKIFFFHSMV